MREYSSEILALLREFGRLEIAALPQTLRSKRHVPREKGVRIAVRVLQDLSWAREEAGWLVYTPDAYEARYGRWSKSA